MSFSWLCAWLVEQGEWMLLCSNILTGRTDLRCLLRDVTSKNDKLYPARIIIQERLMTLCTSLLKYFCNSPFVSLTEEVRCSASRRCFGAHSSSHDFEISILFRRIIDLGIINRAGFCAFDKSNGMNCGSFVQHQERENAPALIGQTNHPINPSCSLTREKELSTLQCRTDVENARIYPVLRCLKFMSHLLHLE